MITVTTRGGDRGVDVVNDMKIDHAISAILNFGKNAATGTTMAYELQSYQNHPDYTRTLSCCKR